MEVVSFAFILKAVLYSLLFLTFSTPHQNFNHLPAKMVFMNTKN